MRARRGKLGNYSVTIGLWKKRARTPPTGATGERDVAAGAPLTWGVVFHLSAAAAATAAPVDPTRDGAGVAAPVAAHRLAPSL